MKVELVFSYPSTVYIDLSDKLRYRIETFTPCLKLSDTTFSNDNPIELIEKIIGISDKNRYYKKIVEQKKNKLLEEMLYDNSKNHKHFRIIDWMFFLYQLSEEIISKQKYPMIPKDGYTEYKLSEKKCITGAG